MSQNESLISIQVVVSGEDVPVKVNVHSPVAELVRRALNDSGNRGQDPSAWVLKTASGSPIDQNQTVSQAGIVDDEKLFLTPERGAGG